MLLARHCEWCGQPMEHYKDKQLYHKECKDAAKKAREKEYRECKKLERQNAPKPIKHCIDCGASLEGYNYRCRYCTDCAKKRHDASKVRNHSKPTASATSNRHKFITADEVTRRANALGLSYGQYSAQYGLYDNIYKGGLHI